MRSWAFVALVVAVLAAPASAAAPRILPFADAWPVWSPDGSRIAFTRIYGSRMVLEVLTRTTGRVRSVASNAGQLSPSWSPDGSRLAFASGGRLYVAAVTGRGLDELAAPARSYAPAWQPKGSLVAFLTTRGARNTDLWTVDVVDGRAALLAHDAIGVPAWAPAGRDVAFQRDDGIYVADVTTKAVRRVALVVNPGPPAWSHDGKSLAFAAEGSVFVVPSDGSQPAKARTPVMRELGTPSWSRDDGRISFAHRGGVSVLELASGAVRTVATFLVGSGGLAPFAPASDAIAYAGPRRDCPGHTAIRLVGGPALTRTCVVAGTARADVIDGSPREGDVILGLGGNDRIHANDGHADRVDCGAGRDVVWADRTDRVRGCERVL